MFAYKCLAVKHFTFFVFVFLKSAGKFSRASLKVAADVAET